MKNILMALMVLLAGTACVSTGLPDGAKPSHRFYAAVADYNAAKIHAVEFVRSPAVTVDTAEAVLRITRDTDAEIAVVVEEIRLNGVPADGYDLATRALRIATERLMAKVTIPAEGVL